DELGVDSFYTVRVAVDGETVALAEKIEERKQTPSYWHSVFTGAGLRLDQAKFISQNNVAVTNLRLTATDGSSKDVTLTGTSPLASTPAGEGEELTGVQDTKNDITTLYPRFSGDGFTAEDGTVSQSVTVPADGEVSTKLQLGLVTDEVAASATEYEHRQRLEAAAADTLQGL